MSPAFVVRPVSLNRLHLQRTFMLSRMQRDQLAIRLEGCQGLGMPEFESALKQAVAAFDVVVADCQAKLAF